MAPGLYKAKPSFGKFVFATTLLVIAQLAWAIQCREFLPEDARPLNDVTVCHYWLSDQQETFACQDHVSKQGIYRILYRSGSVPKAIIKLGYSEDSDAIVWPELNTIDQPFCQLKLPDSIPRSAKFSGLGVCENEHGEAVACGLFRYKVPRSDVATDYLVFYNPDAAKPELEKIISFANQNAIPAEIAYQIGLVLVGLECCRSEGVAYLKYAYELFPDSVIYKRAYLKYKSSQ